MARSFDILRFPDTLLTFSFGRPTYRAVLCKKGRCTLAGSTNFMALKWGLAFRPTVSVLIDLATTGDRALPNLSFRFAFSWFIYLREYKHFSTQILISSRPVFYQENMGLVRGLHRALRVLEGFKTLSTNSVDD